MIETAYFRVHTSEKAYATQRPRGLFVTIGKLVDSKTLTNEEISEYWKNREWFETHLPVPPFYATGNQERAITWFKDHDQGRAMFSNMVFYRAMAMKYGIQLFETQCNRIPGKLIYEDEFQIAVVDGQHEGEGFDTRVLSNNGLGGISEIQRF